MHLLVCFMIPKHYFDTNKFLLFILIQNLRRIQDEQRAEESFCRPMHMW